MWFKKPKHKCDPGTHYTKIDLNYGIRRKVIARANGEKREEYVCDAKWNGLPHVYEERLKRVVFDAKFPHPKIWLFMQNYIWKNRLYRDEKFKAYLYKYCKDTMVNKKVQKNGYGYDAHQNEYYWFKSVQPEILRLQPKFVKTKKEKNNIYAHQIELDIIPHGLKITQMWSVQYVPSGKFHKVYRNINEIRWDFCKNNINVCTYMYVYICYMVVHISVIYKNVLINTK